MAEDYPNTAFVLTLVGAILAFIVGIPLAFLGLLGFSYLFWGSLCFIIPLIGGILGIIAAVWMKNPDRVKTAGVLAIIAAILGGAGIISFILMLIGGILALAWEPSKRGGYEVPPPPPPPP